MVKKVITDFNSLKVAAPDCISPLVGGGGEGGLEGIPPLLKIWLDLPCPAPLPPLLYPKNVDFVIFM